MSTEPAIKPRILVVDDNEINRYTVSRVLERSGFAVTQAGTGGEALRLLEALPDLVILDVKLPDISGLEVCRRLRNNPHTQRIPVLQVSAAFTMTTDRVRGLDAGADGYLASPVEPEELLANVRMLLRLKNAQDELQSTNSRLKSILANIAEVYFVLDHSWRVIEASAPVKKFFNRTPEELRGKILWEEFPQTFQTPFGESYRQAMITQQMVNFEGESVINPGTYWEGHACPYGDRLEIYLRDITERKLAEKRLAETAVKLQDHIAKLEAAQAELAGARDQLSVQNEALEARVRERTAKLLATINDLETFSYSITHDMRAPLRAMQGFARLLLESHSEQLDQQGMEFLHRISNAASRLDMLIRDVLSYSNIIRTELKLVPINLEKLARDILSDYPDLQPAHAEVIIHGPLPVVLGNEAFLTQVLSNLIGNALKFVAKDARPRVAIASQKRGEIARITIADNGIGIPQQHQSRLFGLFQRAQTAYPGTGIGLAVVKKAMERMGGVVGLESAPGQGSTFWFELPLAPAGGDRPSPAKRKTA